MLDTKTQLETLRGQAKADAKKIEPDPACRAGIELLWIRHLAFLVLFAAINVSAQIYPPSSTETLTVFCRSSTNPNRLVPNCTVTVTVTPINNSNGHFHNSNRPSSGVSANRNGPFTDSLTVQTGSTGTKRLWVKFIDIGQQEIIQTCSARGCSYGTHYVGYNSFQFVFPSNDWFHVGGNTTEHGGNGWNHWMTPYAQRNLANTVAQFRRSNPNQGKLALNDMSLPMGGIFDIRKNWRKPHNRHALGTAVDVRGNGSTGSIISGQHAAFAAVCTATGAGFTEHEDEGTRNEHVHCDW